MAVVYNPNNDLNNEVPSASGGLFRQPSNTRKSFSQGSVRRGSGSTAEFTGVRNSFSSSNGRASVASLGNLDSVGSRVSFSSMASSGNEGPAPIEFPNVEHSNAGSVVSSSSSSGSSGSHFRKPAVFSRPLSAVQPVASSLPRRSATASPVSAQGSAARLPPALPAPSRTKMRSPTLAQPRATRVKNVRGSESPVPVVENWMTGKKTSTPFKATFRKNTRRRNGRRNGGRNDRRKSSRKSNSRRKGLLV
jgi:hypothetical protein